MNIFEWHLHFLDICGLRCKKWCQFLTFMSGDVAFCYFCFWLLLELEYAESCGVAPISETSFVRSATASCGYLSLTRPSHLFLFALAQSPLTLVANILISPLSPTRCSCNCSLICQNAPSTSPGHFWSLKMLHGCENNVVGHLKKCIYIQIDYCLFFITSLAII